MKSLGARSSLMKWYTIDMLMKFYNHHQRGSMVKIFMADDYDEDNYDINCVGGDFPSGECIYCSSLTNGSPEKALGGRRI